MILHSRLRPCQEVCNGTNGTSGATGPSGPSGPTGPGTNSGTATQVGFFTSSVNISSDPNLFWDNTNKRLGIGTSAPTEKLHVSGGNELVSGDVYVNSGSNGSIHYGVNGRLGQTTAWSPNSGLAGLWLEGSNDGESGGLFLNGNTINMWSPGDADILRVFDEDVLSATPGSPAFVINGSGNVGIAVTAPVYRLDVSGQARAVTSVTAGVGVVDATNQSVSTAVGAIGVRAGSNNSTSFYSFNTGVQGFGAEMGAIGNGGVGLTTSGTGIAGVGQAQSLSRLTAGQGGAFTGYDTGVYARNASVGTSQAIYTDNGGSITRVNYYNGTQYKINGTGTVSTNVDDGNGSRVTLHAPETPEIYFQDFGTGALVNGRAHIELDPVLARNVVVSGKHPMRVFVQLEGDCNGVYVTNKTATGFDVVELRGGTSSVAFQWTLTCNRADEVLPSGKLSRNADQRFEPAPLDLPAGSSEVRQVSSDPTLEPSPTKGAAK